MTPTDNEEHTSDNNNDYTDNEDYTNDTNNKDSNVNTSIYTQVRTN